MNVSRREILRLSTAAAAGWMLSPARCFGAGPASHPTSAASSMWGYADDPNDRRQDPSYLDQQIRHISDADLFSSINLSPPELAAARQAVQTHDFPAAYRAWGDYWRDVAPRRALFSASSEPAIHDSDLLMSAGDAAATLAPHRDQILSAADRVLRHDIAGWGDVAIQHGKTVDFNADYGKAGKYGFHYWWWARPLIAAYLLTRDPKYPAELDALFNDWYEQRDQVKGALAPLDPIWYELGLGLRNRVFIEYYFLPYADRPASTHERMLKTLLGAARWLYQEERRKYRGGNWQIVGSYGMAQIGLAVREFKESPQWAQLGTRRLLEHVADDFFADGCHSERVPGSYMLVAYRDPRNLALLLSRAGESYSKLAAKMRAPLERTLNWYLYTLPPDGIIPGINDSGRVPMPAVLFEDGVRFFGRQDMAWVAGALVNRSATRPAEAGRPAKTSVQFAPSGFTVMRSDWSPRARYMLINHGPSGGGHSHADSLDFELHAFGQAMAIDAGIGTSYDDPHLGPWYRRTRAHNGLTVDGLDLDRRQAEGRNVAWTSLPHLDYFAATHFGYVDKAGVRHRRQIAFVKPDYWVVYDLAEGRADGGEHALSWNLHAPVKLSRFGTGFASGAGPGLVVLPGSDGWKPRTSTGLASVRGIRGFHRNYAEIDWVIFDGKLSGASPAAFGVLLLPFEDRRPDVRFQLLEQDHRAAHYAVDHGAGTIDHLLFGDPGTTMQRDGLTFSGACAWVRFTDSRPTAWSAAGALTLQVGDVTLIRSETHTDAEGTL